MVFTLLLAGCKSGMGDTAVGYRPPLLPIEISVNGDGDIDVTASPEIATPLGTFSLQQSLAHRTISANQTLLVIRRLVHGALGDYLVKINSSVKMTFLLDGDYDFSSESNVAVLQLHRGVSGIRVRSDTQNSARFSATRVATLPTPTLQPVPSGCPTAAATSCPATSDPSPSRPTTDPSPPSPDIPPSAVSTAN